MTVKITGVNVLSFVDHASNVVQCCYYVLYSEEWNICICRYKFIILYFRPMYVDSTNNDIPAGDQTVAKTLREYVEPLLMVCISVVLVNYNYN